MYFTICIPTFNRAVTISRTLESLIRQDFKDFEIIIIDDGSTDNTREVINQYSKELNLQYVYKENGGKHTALNKGIELANGEFFIILDSDDWLVDNSLSFIFTLCEKIRYNSEYCGVMCRCKNSETGLLIGQLFEEEPFISSYTDFHFGSGIKRRYVDCFEANKTSILKQYRWPEPVGTKFVPEQYIFNQIGLYYKLYCVNQIVEVKEYLEVGITKNKNYRKNNAIGYLWDYISTLDNILPKIKVSLKTRIIAWWKYWSIRKYVHSEEIPCVEHMTFLGVCVYMCTPIIDYLKKG